MRRTLLALLLSGCATLPAPHPDDAIHSQRCVLAMSDGGQPIMVCYAVETCSEPAP